jgi:hypothetical protein
MPSFTRDQVKGCWLADARERSPDTSTTSSETTSTSIIIEAAQADDTISQSHAAEAIMERLLLLAKDVGTHFNSIDEVVSNMVAFRFDSQLEDTVDTAYSLLGRLPPLPPRLDLLYALWKGDSSPDLHTYFSPDVADDWRPQTHPLISSIWGELHVVSQCSTVVVKIALLVASSNVARFDTGAVLHRFLNLISELVDMIEPSRSADPSSYHPKPDQLVRDIVKSYLWSTWTRSLQLFFWYVLRTHLDQGHDESWNRLLALRGMGVLSHPLQSPKLYNASNMKIPYMCTWAFELLKVDRSSVGLDFRHFYQRYAELHGMKGGRCRWGSENPCDGSRPTDCGRFQDKRLVANEQSVHDCYTEDCPKMIWDRTSYIAITGATAISATNSGRIEYIKASERTMAISHVWSHGHGGRPHTGMNECLHARFSNIALQHGCNSYWIDTLCIPDEHQLRREAIGYINWIFAESKVVLVLDRDIMETDISDLTIELVETLLSTFLVCDWNVRAWTMLEAMKGCHNLYLLCKANRMVSLRDCLIRVHQEGRIDLAVLFLASQHLLPTSTDPFRRRSSRKSLEGAGSLLSHRHATRDGDDIVIWSLISGIHVYFNANDLWKAKVGRKIRTAFLMSSSPRVENVPGFSWAPRTPYVRRTGQGGMENLIGTYLVHDGEGSEEAEITRKGLLGNWLVYHVIEEDAERYRDAPVATVTFESGIRKEEFYDSHKTINRCWKVACEYLALHAYVALLHPLWHGRYGTNGESRGRRDSHGTIFAICVSADGEKWIWKGVEVWPRAITTPEMEIDELLLV